MLERGLGNFLGFIVGTIVHFFERNSELDGDGRFVRALHFHIADGLCEDRVEVGFHCLKGISVQAELQIIFRTHIRVSPLYCLFSDVFISASLSAEIVPLVVHLRGNPPFRAENLSVFFGKCFVFTIEAKLSGLVTAIAGIDGIAFPVAVEFKFSCHIIPPLRA